MGVGPRKLGQRRRACTSGRWSGRMARWICAWRSSRTAELCAKRTGAPRKHEPLTGYQLRSLRTASMKSAAECQGTPQIDKILTKLFAGRC
jgi:hypothetical protein